jgi:SAM-dependent methyltransferase
VASPAGRPVTRSRDDGRVARTFDELVAEAEVAPIEGWNFSWLDGRATEERPSWRYSVKVAERAAQATRMLDLQSGGGELLASVPQLPPLLVASEGYGPNVTVAARRLQPRGAHVVATDDDRRALPFRRGVFDLVTSRHPVETWWDEIARVLCPGGTYLSQQVGPSSLRELSEFILGPLPPGSRRQPELARRAAESAGLVVRDLRQERLRTVFNDVGAVVYFLRLVIWIVPGFAVDTHRGRLLALHQEIERHGPFVSYASRFLIEAGKPA